MKAKVLVCHNHYAHQGGESLVFDNLVRGLREHGHSIVPYVRDNGSIREMSLAEKTQLVLTAHHSRRTQTELTALVAAEKPDVAVVQNVFPLMSPSTYTTLHALGVPIVQATYNYRFVCPAGELYSRGEICERCIGGSYVNCAVRTCYRGSRLASAWYASILGWHRSRATFANTVDVFQVPDRFMADKLVEGGLPRAKMVRNVNPFFVSDHRATNRHDGYVAFVGRLVRQKGVLTLVDAVRESKSLRAMIVGEGPLTGELRERVRNYRLGDRVELTGPLWASELHRVLAGACAVAVPSEWYDNLPLALCQANALGKPVLASRINGIPEYVDEGVNGFLFTPGHAGELAAAAERVLSLGPEAYAALSARTRRFAEERLDFREHYRVLSGVFDTLAGSRS